MSYCRKCGAPLSEDAKFCSACGTEVLVQEQAPPSDEPTVVTAADSSRDAEQSASPPDQVSDPVVIEEAKGGGGKGKFIALGVLAVIALIALVAVFSTGGESSEVPETASSELASDPVEGWWVETDALTDLGFSPEVLHVEPSEDGEFVVTRDLGSVDAVDYGEEEFTVEATGSGSYVTPLSQDEDYTVAVSSDVLTLAATDWSTDYARASEAEAQAAMAATYVTEEAATSGSDAGTDDSSRLTSGEYKDKCRTIKFKVLDKDADSLIGNLYTFKGQVFQISDAGTGNYWTDFEDAGYDSYPQTKVLLSITNDGYGWWDDEIMVAYNKKMKKVYDEDIIQVWGECLGTYTYESVAGYTITVPLIQAKYYDKK